MASKPRLGKPEKIWLAAIAAHLLLSFFPEKTYG
jgi:hypothetical protein